MTNREKVNLINEITYEFGTANYNRIKGNEERYELHKAIGRKMVDFAHNNGLDITIYRTNDGEIFACIVTEINNKKVFSWITSCNIQRDTETYKIMTSEIKAWAEVDVKSYYINPHDTLTEYTIK